jgi:D-tagatose-1,6-bisphosphate aldolase subunit GatZ/KbaZ
LKIDNLCHEMHELTFLSNVLLNFDPVDSVKGYQMKLILDVVKAHLAGDAVGIVSVCSAHPEVVRAHLESALATNAPFALIEATSNQVNQYGGYTGMKPADFRDFVTGIARLVNYPMERVVLGGDHLGPNAWTYESSTAAMDKAGKMVAEYVAAGFRKIHLDCSMRCADDALVLPEETIAQRAAELACAAEAAWRASGGEPPVYIIGTEVPVPGGAAEEITELKVTSPQAARQTLETHRIIFVEKGLSDAWDRVIGLVVQPGVEFDHEQVIDYQPDQATALSAFVKDQNQIVFEAHSTDYQNADLLARLVKDHFAILKVGPGVTFALREALWALDALALASVETYNTSLKDLVIRRMQKSPDNWSKYYHGSLPRLEYLLSYSFSDRIRYYWADPEVSEAVDALLDALSTRPPPMPLLSQFLPSAYKAVRQGAAVVGEPMSLVRAHIKTVLSQYQRAVSNK